VPTLSSPPPLRGRVREGEVSVEDTAHERYTPVSPTEQPPPSPSPVPGEGINEREPSVDSDIDADSHIRRSS